MSDAGHTKPFRVAVLASGGGTNLQAILDSVHGRDGIEVVGVGTNKPGVRALERAAAHGVAAEVFLRSAYPDRVARDSAIADWLEEIGAELVVLAGYMELVSAEFVRRFAGRIINVHPALLPAFPGLDAIGQAIAHGAKVTGVTIHFVDEGMDTGPIILQEPVAIPSLCDAEFLAAEIQKVEHRLLPEAVRLAAAGRLLIDPDNPRSVVVSAAD